MTKAEIIYKLAEQTASEFPDMFRKKGPGEGNRFTNRYMSRLNQAVGEVLGKHYEEQKICGKTDQSVDFYVPEESTIIEVELSLYNVHTNLDRDIFKALIAKDAGYRVATLVLIGKEPAEERHAQPASRTLIDFVKRYHNLDVIIRDIKKREREHNSYV